MGLVLENSHGSTFERAIRFNFKATNNEIEYKALASRLELTLDLKVKYLKVSSHSQLIINQFKGEFQVKESMIHPYFEAVKMLTSKFESIWIEHILREETCMLMLLQT